MLQCYLYMTEVFLIHLIFDFNIPYNRHNKTFDNFISNLLRFYCSGINVYYHYNLQKYNSNLVLEMLYV